MAAGDALRRIGQPGPGVSARGLDEGSARAQHASALRVFDERHAEAVFHAPARVSHLELAEDAPGKPARDAAQLDEGRVPHGRGKVPEDHREPLARPGPPCRGNLFMT